MAMADPERMMPNRLPLSIACWDYDRTRAIQDGTIRVDGCDVTYLPLAPEEVFFRAFRHAEFDVAELSLSTYTVLTARGECPYVAIPVFPSRAFRHSGIYVRTDRGIVAPSDLRGRTVGVPEYQVTAAVWMRGLLWHDYGVAPTELRWRTGGVEQPGRSEKASIALDPGLDLAPIGPDRTLGAMLEEGEIDALLAPRAPSCFQRGAAGVGRLFPDFRKAEQDHYRRTGLFPIMHLLGIRRDLAERHPWLGSSLLKAFSEAKRRAHEALFEVTALKVMLPWLVREAEATAALMGEDFWPYGFEANRTCLETFLRYHHEQGLSARRLEPEALFLPSSLEQHKV